MPRCGLETWPSPTWQPSPPSTCQSAPSPGTSWWGCPTSLCRVIACKVGFLKTSLCKKGKTGMEKKYDDHLDLVQPGHSLLWQLDLPLFPRSLLEQVLLFTATITTITLLLLLLPLLIILLPLLLKLLLLLSSQFQRPNWQPRYPLLFDLVYYCFFPGFLLLCCLSVFMSISCIFACTLLFVWCCALVCYYLFACCFLFASWILVALFHNHSL